MPLLCTDALALIQHLSGGTSPQEVRIMETVSDQGLTTPLPPSAVAFLFCQVRNFYIAYPCLIDPQQYG